MEVDRTVGIDHAANDNRITAITGQLGAGQLAGSQPGDVVIGLTVGHSTINCRNPVQLVHGRGIGRGDGQAADVDHTGGANNKAVRVRKDDIAANLATLEAVQGTVDDRARVVDEVDEIARATGHVQIDRIAGVDSEVTEGVEAGLTTHRCGGDVGIGAVDRNRGGGLPSTTGVQRDVIGQTPARHHARSQHQGG